VITGRWGRPSRVLLDIVAGPDGVVRGVVNPDRQNAAIRSGRFDARTGAVHLEGDQISTDGFFEHMGGERVPGERGLFHGAFAWPDVRTLIDA